MPAGWTVDSAGLWDGRLLRSDERPVALVLGPLLDPALKQFDLGGMASLVTGSKGWIWVSRQGVKTEPESLAQTVIRPNEKGSVLRVVIVTIGLLLFINGLVTLICFPALWWLTRWFRNRAEDVYRETREAVFPLNGLDPTP